MSDFEDFKKDILPLTGQNLIDVSRDGLIVETVVFRADLSRRPDVQGWLRYRRRGFDTHTRTVWTYRLDPNPPMAFLIVTAEKPQACRFVLALTLPNRNAWTWIERITMAGFIGLSDRAQARNAQDLLSRTVLIPFIVQPLRDMIEAMR